MDLGHSSRDPFLLKVMRGELLDLLWCHWADVWRRSLPTEAVSFPDRVAGGRKWLGGSSGGWVAVQQEAQ